jgi:outer membrane protein assembly factor BamB
MTTSNIIFVGIKGSVVALNRANGQQIWATRLKGGDFVNVVLDGNVVLATTAGEIFCLDPMTGEGFWHNPLKGFGRDLATIATQANPGPQNLAALSEKRRQQQAAAAAAASS